MDNAKYWAACLSVCVGPAWDDRIFLMNEDGTGRRATSIEFREAAQYLKWARLSIAKDGEY